MNRKKIFTIAIAVIFAAILIVAPFSVNKYILRMLIMLLITALLGQSWNLMSGYAGQFSFGHAVFFGLGAYTSSLLSVKAGVSPWIGMIAGMVVAATVGMFIGYLSFRYRLKGDYFALATLAFAEIFRVLFNNTKSFGGAQGIILPLPAKSNFLRLEFLEDEIYYFLLILLVAGVSLGLYYISRRKFGLNLVAIKTNKEAAAALGVNVLGHQLAAIGISGAIAAAAGTLYAQVYGYIDPSVVFAATISVRAIVPCIIGGSGTVIGPVLGALIIVPLQEMCNSVFTEVKGLNMILYGAIIVVFVLFCPNGILGLVKKIKDGYKKKRSEAK